MVQKYKVKVKEIIQETHDTKAYRVVFDELEKLDFLAGQFFMVWKEDFKNERESVIRRPYSVASSPDNKDYLEFCIKKEGVFSNMMFNITVGTELMIEGPYGRFVLNDEYKNKDFVFFAGGSGISSLISMIRRLKYEKNKQKIFLFFGFRDTRDFIYKDEITKYPKEFANFELIPCVSSGEKLEIRSEDGRINLEIMKKYLKNPENKNAFICGAPDFVKDVKKLCLDFGFKEENVHVEVY